jgi:ABC-type nitrate/sulfonate/bicarbonate transport system substrate-binding protein
VESISIGTTNNETNALILIAQEQGYFTANGLDVTQQIYSSGVAAINGMLGGEVDMATGSEFAFAGEILSGENISAIGVINRSSVNYLVARVDAGISVLADIKGKRIGVPLGSRPEFALDRFLTLRGIDTSAVTLVNVPVSRSLEALVNGEVDAVASWQPYIDQIRERFSDRVAIWGIQENQPSYTIVMSRSDWTAENPEPIKRFLKSLIQAESYAAGNAGASKGLIASTLHYDEAYIESVWPDNLFTVSLDQSLIIAMEDQSRWLISNNLTASKAVPNFLDYIYADGLRSVAPGAVRIAGA